MERCPSIFKALLLGRLIYRRNRSLAPRSKFFHSEMKKPLNVYSRALFLVGRVRLTLATVSLIIKSNSSMPKSL